ncbi:hypothetical protein HYR99_11815 [Candidatus Poribacteria bacterium]|nr:hypothetical protein [Candidatus Poribacteria bacterium]
MFFRTNYQATTTIAFHRFVQLCCCALSIGRLILCSTVSLPWVTDSQTVVNESMFSLAKLRRWFRCYVIKGLLFSKPASGADSARRSNDALEAILRPAG